jgi:general secretion pathway protein J
MSPRSCFSSMPPRDVRGFTLIEVLVAVSLLAIVLTSVYGIFGSVNSAKLRLDSDSAEYHLARVVLDRVGRDIHGVYYRTKDQTTMFRGGINDQGESFLELTTTAVTALNTTGAGIAAVRYRLALDQDSPDKSQRVLLRSEYPRQLPVPAVDNSMTRLAPDVATMAFRFYYNGSWQEQWDAQQQGLPQLVEISMVIGQDPQKQTHFTTTFELPDISVK